MANMEDNFDILKEIIKESMVETLTKLLINYYHYYKKDEDSLLQIYNSLVELYILDSKSYEKMYNEVIENLETKYFYTITEYNPLKIESSI